MSETSAEHDEFEPSVRTEPVVRSKR
jgi:hypothetical protein